MNTERSFKTYVRMSWNVGIACDRNVSNLLLKPLGLFLSQAEGPHWKRYQHGRLLSKINSLFFHVNEPSKRSRRLLNLSLEF